MIGCSLIVPCVHDTDLKFLLNNRERKEQIVKFTLRRQNISMEHWNNTRKAILLNIRTQTNRMLLLPKKEILISEFKRIQNLGGNTGVVKILEKYPTHRVETIIYSKIFIDQYNNHMIPEAVISSRYSVCLSMGCRC